MQVPFFVNWVRDPTDVRNLQQGKSLVSNDALYKSSASSQHEKVKSGILEPPQLLWTGDQWFHPVNCLTEHSWEQGTLKETLNWFFSFFQYMGTSWFKWECLLNYNMCAVKKWQPFFKVCITCTCSVERRVTQYFVYQFLTTADFKQDHKNLSRPIPKWKFYICHINYHINSYIYSLVFSCSNHARRIT